MKPDLIIYHGSQQIVEVPKFGIGKTYNDYGQGFYCTEHMELAKEWACTFESSGFANKYALNLEGLKILDLGSSQYTILHWLALLVANRQFAKKTPLLQLGAKWLLENYLLDLAPYDIVRGYRADDSYFAFARAFLSNQISLEQLQSAMQLGKLGEQIVLKTPKAFSQIKFLESIPADNIFYYIKRQVRDEQARQAYADILTQNSLQGIYIRDLMKAQVKSNGTRL